MSQGPSKLLYAAGGWLLGGFVAGLAGVAIGIALGVFGVELATAVLVGQIITLGGSITGTYMGWKKASQEQQQLQAYAPAQTSSRSMGVGQSPELYQDVAPETGKSFSDGMEPKSRQGGYAEAIANEQQQATFAAR